MFSLENVRLCTILVALPYLGTEMSINVFHPPKPRYRERWRDIEGGWAGERREERIQLRVTVFRCINIFVRANRIMSLWPDRRIRITN